MTLANYNQLNLYGLENELTNFVNLFEINKLPNKILISGQKGIGKSTLSYHLINYILSKNEEFPYNLDNYSINENNRSFKLIQNNSHTNFHLIDISSEKKNIDISQIRNLIQKLEKSSFNSKPRFILIDNIEFLNVNSVNALLKILEEPPDNTFFILINSNNEILPTIKSRCLNFKISMSNKTTLAVSNKLLGCNINEIVNEELINYYFTPGKIFNLIYFAKENKIDLKLLSIQKFLNLIIDNLHYKKESKISYIIFDFVEIFLSKFMNKKYHDLHSYFLKRIEDIKKFNLDKESFFLELKSKLLNE